MTPASPPTLHPQTRGAWARAVAILRSHRSPPPYTKKERARAKYERTWDAIEAKIAGTPGSSLWWEEVSAAHEKERRERAEKERQERALQAIRDRLGKRGGASPEARAEAWLATIDGSNSHAAYRAALGLVRGFALPASDALAMLSALYIPRYHRKVPPHELRGWIQRAGRSQLPLGYLLERKR